MYVDEPAVVDPDVLLGLVAVAVHGTRAATVSARRLLCNSTTGCIVRRSRAISNLELNEVMTSFILYSPLGDAVLTACPL